MVRFGDVSGSFGLAMARPNLPDIPPKSTKKVRLGIKIVILILILIVILYLFQ